MVMELSSSEGTGQEKLFSKITCKHVPPVQLCIPSNRKRPEDKIMNRLPPVDRRAIHTCKSAKQYVASLKTSRLEELLDHPNEDLAGWAEEELMLRDEARYDEECWRETLGVYPGEDSPSLQDRFGDAWLP
jgi:hypothetical protein